MQRNKYESGSARSWRSLRRRLAFARVPAEPGLANGVEADFRLGSASGLGSGMGMGSVALADAALRER